MAGPVHDWHPTPAEVERIVVEMRPIIAAFARQAARECAGREPLALAAGAPRR